MTEKQWKRYFYVIVIGAAAVYGCLNAHYRTGIFNDDAVYVLSARDLWNRITPEIFPQIRRDFPMPGLPVVLAPAAAVVGSRWVLLEWVSTIVSVLSVILLGQWTRLWLKPKESLMVAALYAFNPAVVKYSGILMPAPYYSLAVIGAFYLLHQWLQRPRVWISLALGAVLGWACLLRSEGFLLLICIIGPLAILQRHKTFLLTMFIPLAGWALFFLVWIKTRSNPVSEYKGDIAGLASYWWNHAASAFLAAARMVDFVVINTFFGAWLPEGPFWRMLDIFLIFLALGLIVFGFLRLWKEKSMPHISAISLVLFCGLYMATHVLWNVAERRYFIVILPFAFACFARAIHEWPGARRFGIRWALITGMIGTYTYSNAHSVYEAFLAPDPRTSPPFRSLKWLSDHTPPHSRILSTTSPSIALYTRRYSVGPPAFSTLEEFIEALHRLGIDYIVDRNKYFLTPGVGTTQDLNEVWLQIRRWVKRYPRFFEPVFSDRWEETKIFRVASDDPLPKAARAYLAAARAYRDSRLEESLKKLKTCLQSYPDFGPAYNLLGVLRLKENHFSDAERAFVSAIRLLPDSPAPHVNMATLHYLSGRQKQANDSIRQGLELAISNGRKDLFVRNVQKLFSGLERGEPTYFIEAP